MIEVKKKIRAKLSLRSFKSTAENLRERLKTGDNHPAQNMFMVRCVTISQKKKRFYANTTESLQSIKKNKSVHNINNKVHIHVA